jgi:membrane associated rhomboid family serine protease
MFAIVPLGKKGSTGIPIFTIFICVVCIIVHVFVSTDADLLALAFYPQKLDPLKMFTSVFTHADIWHLVGNLFFFYCFSRTIETQITAVGYLLSFVVFVLATNLTFALTATSEIPTVGLSGVVWGYMGMFLFRYPRDNINCFVWFIWIFKTIEVPVFMFILAFLALNIAEYRHGADTGINYVEHLSGFAAGVLYKLAFWKTFTTEKPEAPRKRSVLGEGRTPARLPRR